jgi:hypothetical protein
MQKLALERARLLLLACCCVRALCACSSSAKSQANAPTYYEDVAPLLNRSCNGCHLDGGIAPFALTSYDAARSEAADIVSATTSCEMPPMPVNNDGSCNTYANARWLSSDEIGLLQRWQEAGAPAGDPKHAPSPPLPLPTLTAPDATLDTGASYTPSSADGHDDYRCFVLPAPVDQVRYLTEYEVLPGAPRVVHHVIVYQPDSDDDAEAASALDDAAPGLGYPCFGGAGVTAKPLAMWAPGAGAITLPEGTGVLVAANRNLIMQIHYNLDNGVVPDETRVALRFATQPVITAGYLPIANLDVMLPPGRTDVETMASVEVDAPTLKVYGAMPHMHTLGRTLHVDVQANGESTCLVDVDRWDFHWQNAWWYDTPLTLENTTATSIRCGFDTSTEDHVVTWGENTSDEMCLSFFYVTVSDTPTPVVSCQDPQNPLYGSCLDDLLSGCYAPDLSGTCASQNGTVTWSDGSKLVPSGADAGLYSAGSQTPCVNLALMSGSAVLTKGAQQVTYSGQGDSVTIQCPDLSTVRATGAQLTAFNLCRGINCPN